MHNELPFPKYISIRLEGGKKSFIAKEMQLKSFNLTFLIWGKLKINGDPAKNPPQKNHLCLLQCRTAGCICEIARVEAAGGMSSSAVAPIKRPRNFRTPTADASTPDELGRAASLNKPDKHHGTSRASRRHHECVSPCWNMQPGHTPGEVFHSLPPTHLAAARRSYAPSSHSFSQEESRPITRPLSQRLAWKVSPAQSLKGTYRGQTHHRAAALTSSTSPRSPLGAR